MVLVVTHATHAAVPSLPRVADVRAWWRVQHPRPSITQRLDAAYTATVTVGIFGLLAYGTASSALAQVISPRDLPVLGPPLALLALVLVAQSGAYLGPVVFAVPDVVHLLGAPLSRRELAKRRLLGALTLAALGGSVAGAAAVVGVAGQQRGLAADRALGLVGGFADLGVLATAAAWSVQRSARWETAARRALWPTALLATSLAGWSHANGVGRTVALWSGPWGWAMQPGTGSERSEWLAAFSVLTITTAAVAVAAMRSAGNCPTERHLVRAEAGTSAVASLASFDARTARRTLERIRARTPSRAPAQFGWLRATVAAHTPGALPVIWSDAATAARSPGRLVQAAALAGSATTLALAQSERPLVVAVAMLLLYAAAARLLGALRAELDVPSRARVLLRPRVGRVLIAHSALPIAVIATTACAAATGCALASAPPEHSAAAAAAAVVVAPLVALCAALSARRGGRLPYSLLIAAIAGDPSGGGVTLISWAVLWPTIAAALGTVPLLLVTSGGPGATLLAAGWTAAAAAVLVPLLGRD
jgi:hypothetical protein